MFHDLQNSDEDVSGNCDSSSTAHSSCCHGNGTVSVLRTRSTMLAKFSTVGGF